MQKILITDSEAKHLIEILKYIIKKYNVPLDPGSKGVIELDTDEKYEFFLHYFVSPNVENKMSVHLRQKTTNINLVRINIDPNGFHKNGNKQKIFGNRLLIYSQEEWIKKADGKTYVQAYNVPEEFTDTTNLEQVFLDFLVYIHVKEENKLLFNSKLI